ncbi:MAG: MFS transporter [Cyclobacteriaceae bacterium]|nr:MFS transporter [Cyclobacteriaceae bacterium]
MKRNYYIIGLIFFIFFVISFLTNIMGPLVPEIIDDFQLSLTLVAILPFAFFVAYGVFSIPSGILVEKYGEQKVMVWAFFISFLGALSLGLFPNYLMAILSLFLIGSGMAMLQVAINPLLRTAGGEEHFAFNSVMAQMFFGLASFLSPLAYSYLVTNLEAGNTSSNFLLHGLASVVPDNLSWVSMYWLFAAISVLMVVLIRFSKFPSVELKEDEKMGTSSTIIHLIKNPVVIAYFFGIFFYVGTEQGVNNWVSEFLQTYHGADPVTTGANVVSRFWGLMTVGTLLGLLLLKLMDSRYVLMSFTVAAMVSLAAALYGSLEVSVIAFPLVGFFASVMWSILISLALNSVPEHHGTVAGILVTGIVGGAVWPLMVGSIGDVFGLKTGMLLLFLSMGYILVLAYKARPLVTNKTISWKPKKE